MIKEDQIMIVEINKILKDIFGESAHITYRSQESLKESQRSIIGFCIDENFSSSKFLNFLIRNLRTKQLEHPNYFSFYIKDNTTPDILYVAKIGIQDINSEIAECGAFPIFDI